jgi:hypothetical protein
VSFSPWANLFLVFSPTVLRSQVERFLFRKILTLSHHFPRSLLSLHFVTDSSLKCLKHSSLFVFLPSNRFVNFSPLPASSDSELCWGSNIKVETLFTVRTSFRFLLLMRQTEARSDDVKEIVRTNELKWNSRPMNWRFWCYHDLLPCGVQRCMKWKRWNGGTHMGL